MEEKYLPVKREVEYEFSGSLQERELQGNSESFGREQTAVEQSNLSLEEGELNDTCQHMSRTIDVRNGSVTGYGWGHLKSIRSDSSNYYQCFHSTGRWISFEKAAELMRQPEKYAPILDGNCFELPKSIPLFGTFAIMKWSTTVEQMMPNVDQRLYQLPRSDDFVGIVSRNKEDFIQVVYILYENGSNVYPIALLAYYNNPHRIVVSPNGSCLPAEISEIFSLLTGKRRLTDQAPSDIYLNEYTSYYYLLNADSCRHSSERACHDGIQWVWKKGKSHSKNVIPKWEFYHILRSDVEAGNFNVQNGEITEETRHLYLELRRQRASHPLAPIARNIAFFTELSSKKKIACPSVFVEYIIQDPFGLDENVVMGRLRPRTPNHMMMEIRKALYFRTARGAHHVLREQAETSDVPISTVRRAAVMAPSVIKSKVGRRPHVDVERMAASTLQVPGCVMMIDNLNTPTGIHVTFLKDSWRAFMSNLPDVRTLCAFRELVSKIDSITDRNERLDYVETLIKCRNKNGYLPCAGIIFVDTTFGVAPWFVTIVYGSLTSVETKEQGDENEKSVHLPLAIVYHKEKHSVSHAFVVKVLQAGIDRLPNFKNKAVSCLMTDKELALEEYLELSICRYAVPLKCCVHLRKNIVKGQKLSVRSLFGTRYDSTLTNGLLGALCEKEFSHVVRRILSSEEESSVIKIYIDDNQASLFEYYSLRRKLEAGFVQQYASTNVLECFNNVIKKVFSGSLDIVESQLKFIQFNREFLNEICRAVMGNSQTLKFNGTVKWNDLDMEEQDQLLQKLGIPMVKDNKWDHLAAGFFDALSSNINDLEKRLPEFIVNWLPPSSYLITNIGTDSYTKVHIVEKNGTVNLVCTRNQDICKRVIMCTHKIVAFFQLDKEQQTKVSDFTMKAGLGKSLLQKNTAQGCGMKTKRLYDQRSKRNGDRGVAYLNDATLLYEDVDYNESFEPLRNKRQANRAPPQVSDLNDVDVSNVDIDILNSPDPQEDALGWGNLSDLSSGDDVNDSEDDGPLNNIRPLAVSSENVEPGYRPLGASMFGSQVNEAAIPRKPRGRPPKGQTKAKPVGKKSIILSTGQKKKTEKILPAKTKSVPTRTTTQKKSTQNTQKSLPVPANVVRRRSAENTSSDVVPVKKPRGLKVLDSNDSSLHNTPSTSRSSRAKNPRNTK